jgi:hypothetical protein
MTMNNSYLTRSVAIASTLTALCLGLWACSDDDNGGPVDPGSCNGVWAGTYTGVDTGVVTATLGKDGKLAVTFVSGSGASFSASGTVSESGDFTATGEGLEVSGKLDLKACSGSGTWKDTVADKGGDWTMKKDTTVQPDSGPTPIEAGMPEGGGPKDTGPNLMGDCAGNYTGSYQGGDTGAVNAVLKPSGQLEVTFVPSGGGASLTGTATVDKDGNITGSGQLLLFGRLTMETCSGNGSWKNEVSSKMGTWTAKKI